jgi:hypothetical protein
VAGHGEVYTSPVQANQAIEYTIARLENILEQTRAALAYGEARQMSDVLHAVAQAQGAAITSLSQYVLYTTTIQSALSALYARGEANPSFQDNYLLWQRS